MEKLYDSIITDIKNIKIDTVKTPIDKYNTISYLSYAFKRLQTLICGDKQKINTFEYRIKLNIKTISDDIYNLKRDVIVSALYENLDSTYIEKIFHIENRTELENYDKILFNKNLKFMINYSSRLKYLLFYNSLQTINDKSLIVEIMNYTPLFNLLKKSIKNGIISQEEFNNIQFTIVTEHIFDIKKIFNTIYNIIEKKDEIKKILRVQYHVIKNVMFPLSEETKSIPIILEHGYVFISHVFNINMWNIRNLIEIGNMIGKQEDISTVESMNLTDIIDTILKLKQ